MTKLEKRFWSKVRKADSCWEWIASVNQDGYGSFRLGGRMDRAHRVSWMLAGNVIPPGVHVLHRCDNPKCVNPSHLFLGTNADNVADRVSKGRSSSGKAEGHGRAKLRAVDIPVIRKRLVQGDYQKDIARDYGVTQPCVGYLARGVTWRAVQ